MSPEEDQVIPIAERGRAFLTQVTKDFRGQTKEESVDQFKDHLNLSVNYLKLQYPNDAELLEDLAVTTFGPLYPGYHDLRAERSGFNEAVISARAQQNLVHLLIHASSGRAEQQIVDQAYFIASAFDHLSQLPDPESKVITDWWKGVKSQYILMKLFKNQGFEVRVPDPTPKVIKGHQIDEVQEFDVKAGIDFLVRGKLKGRPIVICVDAKSNYANKPPFYRMSQPQPLEEYQTTRRIFPFRVTKAIESFKNDDPEFRNANIICVQMGATPIREHLYLNQFGDKAEALRDFASLNREREEGIMSELEFYSQKFAA